MHAWQQAARQRGATMRATSRCQTAGRRMVWWHDGQWWPRAPPLRQAAAAMPMHSTHNNSSPQGKAPAACGGLMAAVQRWVRILRAVEAVVVVRPPPHTPFRPCRLPRWRPLCSRARAVPAYTPCALHPLHRLPRHAPLPAAAAQPAGCLRLSGAGDDAQTCVPVHPLGNDTGSGCVVMRPASRCRRGGLPPCVAGGGPAPRTCLQATQYACVYMRMHVRQPVREHPTLGPPLSHACMVMPLAAHWRWPSNCKRSKVRAGCTALL